MKKESFHLIHIIDFTLTFLIVFFYQIISQLSLYNIQFIKIPNVKRQLAKQKIH